MRIVVLKESAPEERRVALTPDGVKDLSANGHSISVEPGSGIGSFIKDAAYEASGASIDVDLAEADLLIKVMPPTESEIARLRPGAATVSFLNPTQHPLIVEALRANKISSFAIDLMPRISRAHRPGRAPARTPDHKLTPTTARRRPARAGRQDIQIIRTVGSDHPLCSK